MLPRSSSTPSAFLNAESSGTRRWSATPPCSYTHPAWRPCNLQGAVAGCGDGVLWYGSPFDWSVLWLAELLRRVTFSTTVFCRLMVAATCGPPSGLTYTRPCSYTLPSRRLGFSPGAVVGSGDDAMWNGLLLVGPARWTTVCQPLDFSSPMSLRRWTVAATSGSSVWTPTHPCSYTRPAMRLRIVRGAVVGRGDGVMWDSCRLGVPPLRAMAALTLISAPSARSSTPTSTVHLPRHHELLWSPGPLPGYQDILGLLLQLAALGASSRGSYGQ